MTILADNFSRVATAMESACAASGRSLREITLIAVSKNQPLEKVRAALDAGHRHFGENRVQDALKTWTPWRAAHRDLVLHLIGPLQTNKVKDAVALFDVIHSLDREKLACALWEEEKKRHRKLRYFIEVNLGEEPQKSGIAPRAVREFVQFCRDDLTLGVIGLMAIPPAGAAPAPYFQQLKKMADDVSLPHLSMGMSGDFEDAIRCGATHVRIGTALFGAR